MCFNHFGIWVVGLDNADKHLLIANSRCHVCGQEKKKLITLIQRITKAEAYWCEEYWRSPRVSGAAKKKRKEPNLGYLYFKPLFFFFLFFFTLHFISLQFHDCFILYIYIWERDVSLGQIEHLLWLIKLCLGHYL